MGEAGRPGTFEGFTPEEYMGRHESLVCVGVESETFFVTALRAQKTGGLGSG